MRILLLNILIRVLLGSKNSLISPRRIFSNKNINAQNITAALNSGFDLSLLNKRTVFTQALHTMENSLETQNSNPAFSKL